MTKTKRMTTSDWHNDSGKCSYYRPAITDKDQVIRTFMHYSDSEARGEPITVFGERKKPALFYNYSDRLIGDKWTEGCKIANKTPGVKQNTARWFETVLNTFHSTKTVNLQHIMLGVNCSNGYHYLVFGYTYDYKNAD